MVLPVVCLSRPPCRQIFWHGQTTRAEAVHTRCVAGDCVQTAHKGDGAAVLCCAVRCCLCSCCAAAALASDEIYLSTACVRVCVFLVVLRVLLGRSLLVSDMRIRSAPVVFKAVESAVRAAPSFIVVASFIVWIIATGTRLSNDCTTS